MKVALFHDFLVRMGGAELVLMVFAEMFPDAPIYTTCCDFTVLERRYPGLSSRIRVVPAAQIRFSFLKSLPLIGNMATKIMIRNFPRYIDHVDLSGYDMVILNSTAWSHGVITPTEAKVVTYMHAPMRFVWDWYSEYKQSFNVGNHQKILNVILTMMLSKARIWDQVASKRESLLLCNSKTTQKRIKKYHRKEAQVLFPPVEIEHIPTPKSNTPIHDNYFLVISTLAQYKRVDLAVDLFTKLGRKLIIIGDGPELQKLKHRAGPSIIFTGFVSQEEKLRYLERCRALIFPTEDDFGMVPIEAMAAGKPVLAYQKGGALEYIIPGKTGNFFLEQTAESMERGLAELLDQEEHFQPRELRSFAEQFSKTTFLRKFREILKKELNVEI